MFHSSLPLHFWDHVFQSVVFIINLIPPSTPPYTPPYTLLFHHKPDYTFLRIIGCLCYPLIRPYNSHKLQFRALPCVFLGYCQTQKGYKCLHIPSNKIYVSRNVRFDESQFPFVSSVLQSPESHSSGSLDIQTWLPLLPTSGVISSASEPLPQPTTASGLSQGISGPSPSAASPAHALVPPLLVGSRPGSGPSVVGADPSPVLHTYFRRPTALPHPSSVAADPRPILTYSRRPKTLAPSAAADLSPVQTSLLRAHLLSSPPVSPALSLSSTAGTSTEPTTPASVPSQLTHSTHPMTTRHRDNTRRSTNFPGHVTYLTTNHPLPPSSSSLNEPTSFTQANKHPEWRVKLWLKNSMP